MLDKLGSISWRHLFSDTPLQSPVFDRWQSWYRRLFKSRWTIIVLLLLGMARGILFLAAYAPADGADAGDYYLYAAYMAGYELPDRVANISPMYSGFIYLNHYVLGHFELIIFWQFLMSALLGVLMYLALRGYNALLGILVALLVLGDAQIGILFNFASTEPLYIFLLCVMFAAALSLKNRSWLWQCVLLGMLLALLRETRTVALYLFVPVMLLFAIYTRSYRRILPMVASFIIMVIGINLVLQTAQVEQVSTTNANMYVRPLFQYDLLDPAAGPASQQLEELRKRCREEQPNHGFMNCAIGHLGTEAAATALFERAYQETLLANPNAMLEKNIADFHSFLLSSGQQYHGSPTPAEIQCEDVEDRAERNINGFLDREWVDLSLSPRQLIDLRTVTHEFTQQMCPPWPESTAARQITDFLGSRYRSLSRPQPYVWNAILFIFIIAVPWARRYGYPFLLAGAIWVYHAAVSAAVANVQPRYIVVTNPMKAVLVVLMIFLLGQLLLRLLDAALLSRRQPELQVNGEHSD